MSSWNEYKNTILEETASFQAAREGNVEILHRRLPTLSSINEKNAKGHSLLMLSSYNGHLEATRYLLKMKADPNSIDDSSNSILMGASFKGHGEIVDLLLKSGADKKYKNSKGQTALQFAEMFGRREVISLLLVNEVKGFACFLKSIRSWIFYFIQQITRRPQWIVTKKL